MTHEPLRPYAGMPIVFGGDKVAFIPEALAAAFQPGDRLIVVGETGELLHVTAAAAAAAQSALAAAGAAFAELRSASEEALTAFFAAFAGRLADDGVWRRIAAANAADVAAARAHGRATSRLGIDAAMRGEMIAGLEAWRGAPPQRGRTLERVTHEGWSLEQSTAALGVVGFVFEGRPNVVADAAGVLRGGNAAVLRIGADALATARAIIDHAAAPALASAGLPTGALGLVESSDHAAAWALFADPRLALAIARGSGPAVSLLGAIARQSGTPVSLHGAGGAWLIVDASADAARFGAAVAASLDRKVCNTLNVCCIVRARAADLVPVFLKSLTAAGEALGGGVKLHVAAGDEDVLPREWRRASTRVRRADGEHDEPQVEAIPTHDLGREWEWEATPEVALKIVDSLTDAITLFNDLSPRLGASLIAEDAAAHELFFATLDAPFVGDGFTRWIDGQYAFGRPELGISNWRSGRLFGRGAILSGDGVFTVRTRMRQQKIDLRRRPAKP